MTTINPEDINVIPKDSDKNAEDEHPFFHYYGMLLHQQNMLQDSVRTSTYQRAILENPTDFKNKVVLDVGTGSGILAFFAIQAGAKLVYAVEASNVAESARKLVEGNGLSDRIIVIKGKVEDIELPEKVDVIISEPMGFLLVHERMLDSYIVARQRFLKPNGLMMPTLGTIFIAPFTDADLYTEQLGKVGFWSHTDFYGVDLSCLAEKAMEDHFSQPVVGYFDPSSLLTDEVCTHRVDFQNNTLEDLATIEMPFSYTIQTTGILHGIASWFDVTFNGASSLVRLSTSPSAPATHWYQCRLLLPKPIAVNASQVISGTMKMVANDRKSYTIDLTVNLEGTSITSSNRYNLEDQMYHYLTSSTSQVAADGTAHGYGEY